MKKIRIDAAENEGYPSTAIREISVLKTLIHPNIVTLKEIYSKINSFGQHSLYLGFEHCETDLRKTLQKGKIKPDIVRRHMYQLLRGLDFLHRRGIIHRDLKPQNILVQKSGLLKIADFGLARSFLIPIEKLTHEVRI
jgi:serine/threonine protein kinase